MRVTRPPAHDPVVLELCAEQQAELAYRQRDVVDDTPKHLDPRIAFVLLWPEASQGDGAGGEAEAMAGERGLHALRLETGRLFTEAIGLYTASGYVRVPRFGPYAACAESVCFEKRLSAPQGAAALGA